MAHVRFQLKQVNGKSQIYFGDEQNKDKKKFGYKGRDQRFPLRGKEAADPSGPPSKEQGKAPTRPGPTRTTRAPLASKRTPAGGADTVTLTQDQLQLILNSVGKTAASERDNSVRISVAKSQKTKQERTEGGVNIETQASPRRRDAGGDYRHMRRRRVDDDDEDSALGDTGPSDVEDEGRPTGGRRGRQETAPRFGGGGGGENIMGLLGGGGGGGGGGRDASKSGPKRPPPGQTKAKPKLKTAPAKSGAGRGSKMAAEEAGATQDVDEKMRRIIAQNKGKMEESELVDLLAAVYMEERKKQMDLKNGGDKLESEGNLRQPGGGAGRGRNRRDDDDRIPGLRKGGGRRYDEDDDEDEDRRPRRTNRARRDDDEDDASLDRRRGRGGSRRPRYDDDDDNENDRRRRRSPENARRRRYPDDDDRRRRRYESEEEEDADYRRRDRDRERKQRSKRDSDEEESVSKKKEEEKVEPPKFLTAVEKKRLQWEKEREENAKIKEYDPWNRPGAGAPPKDYFSDAAASMKKKEEEQQRYARELDAQRREKKEMAEESRRGGGGGGGGGSEEFSGGPLGNGSSLNNSGNFARGRGFASLDEKSVAEQEERRKRQEEHQEAIKRQVEEQQAKRAQERQRRIDEELREEAKLQRERDSLQRQYEDEQVRVRRREAEQETRLAQLQAANEAAEAAARFDKAQRRLQHLETSGHDTSGLRASLEAQLTARSQATGAPPSLGPPPVVHVRHAAVPGLEGIAEVADMGGGGTGRWATPREVRVFGAPKAEDLQVQTDASLLQPIIQQAVEMAISSSAQARDLPMRSQARQHDQRDPPGPGVTRKIADMVEREGRPPRYERGHVITQRDKKSSVRSRHPIPVEERPRWGAANPKGRRTLPQSEREVAAAKRQDRETRRARRQAELLAEMEANQHRVPRGPSRRQRYGADSPANWPGPEEDGPMVPLSTYNLDRDDAGQPRTGRLTPPLPSRRRLDQRGAGGGPLATSRSEENLAGLTVRAAAALPADGDLGIVRTSEILNPAAAARPLPVSRENTERQLARKTYLKGLNPAHFGEHMANLDDHRMEEGLERRHHQAKNPIFNPGIVKDMPTPRQDAILQHLSDIRKNLLLKQREIETSLSLGGNV